MNGSSRAIVPFSTTQHLSLLRLRSLPLSKQLHAHLLSAALLPPSTPISSTLAATYALCGDLPSARHLFDQIPHRTPFLWNSLIRGYTQLGRPTDALKLFAEMMAAGDRPDWYTFTFTLKGCADLSLRQLGTQVHGKAVVCGFAVDGYLRNALISFYMSCEDVEQANQVFDEIPKWNAASWSSMIAGLVRCGRPEKALELFERMVDAGIRPDCVTSVSVLPACSASKDLRRGRLVHDAACEEGFIRSVVVRNALIDMYVKCGSLEEARRLFESEKLERDVVTWTSMIGGFILNGCRKEAIYLFRDMLFSGIRPNAVTMASVLSGCADSSYRKYGKGIHGLCIRLYLLDGSIVETSLINMYNSCGYMNLGSMVFAKSSKQTAVWNAVISCYCQNGQAKEAIEHFKSMLRYGMPPNDITVMSVLPAYSDLADLCVAQNIHGYLIKTGFFHRVEVQTGLVDLYAKMGSLDIACSLFVGVPMKDTIAWSTIIAGYGKHGQARKAMELFDKMLESGIEPNEVTLMSILQACSYAGLVDEGFDIFKRMVFDNRCVKPGPDHYVCIIDLLGRAGQLAEARELITGMSFTPNYAIWGALLGGCVIHRNVELGEEAARHLFELEPENTGNYVLLGNIYAAVGRWKDVESMRKMVKERGLAKSPGCSLVEARSQQLIRNILNFGHL